MGNKTIVVMEQFFSQLQDLNLSKKAYDSIREEINLLSKFDSSTNLFSYLKNQNAKKLQGHAHQFKYRMNRGDRIFFTYGKYIKDVPENYKEAIFIYGYSTHENQDKEIIPEYDNSTPYQPARIEEVTAEEYVSDDNVSFFTNEEITKLYLNNHSFFVFDEANLPDEISEADVLLSEEQDLYIQLYAENPCPTLVLGGAGTGKTVMELHFLHDFEVANPDSDCAYFTQSFPLLKKSEERYRYIIGKDDYDYSRSEKCEFNNLQYFCINLLNSSENTKKLQIQKLIQQDDFYDFLEESKLQSVLKKNDISEYALWAEIRGTIKGSLDENWCRYKSFNQADFPGSFINILKTNELISQNTDDPRHFRIRKPENLKYELSLFKNKNDTDCFHKIEKMVSSVNPDEPLLPYEDYLKITEENSTLNKTQREVAYDIAGRYQKWLTKNGRYDDNDLIRLCLMNNLTEKKYDFIVIDEIQDYTELQLFFILSFARNYNNVIMAGDEHQIVNPTIFSEERLKKFFYLHNNGKNLESYSLKKNFRCPKDIVTIANKLTKLSKELIASKGENDLEQSVFTSEMPVKLICQDTDICSLIDEMLLYPNVAFLVPDEASRNHLIELYGRTKYELSNNPIISTISEIKGMEYQYVVSYNLVGNYDSHWEQILSGNALHTTKYRYFFNLFYVGLTRVQKYLSVIDNTKTDLFDNFDFDIQESIKKVSEFLSRIPKNQGAWIKQVKKEIESGSLEKAKILINNIDDETTKEILLLRIAAQEALQSNDSDRAVKYFILLQDMDQAEKYCKFSQNDSLKKLVNLLLSEQKFSEFKNYGNLIDELYSDFEVTYIYKMKNILLKRISAYIAQTRQEIDLIMDME